MKSNKKQIISILAILTMAILLSCAFVACDKVDTDKTGTDIVADYKVTIHPNNGQGDIVWDITKEIPTITKEGYHIAGYFLDAQLTISTTLESLKATGITKNIDVYIKWAEDVCEHVEVTDAAVAPTCTEKGLTEGKHCSKCGKILKPQTEIDALGHDLENHAGQPATCTEKGWKEYDTCKREGCDYSTYEEIPALGHKGGTATCTEQAVCERCNEKYGNPLGHDLEHHAGQPATCTEKGWHAYDTCKRDGCTYTTYQEIDALGHDLEHHVGQPATCTEKGWKEYDTCKREGCDHTTYEEIPALGHTGGKATCTEQAICERCGNKYGDALGHKYGDLIPKTEPTCSENGVDAHYKCSVCNKVFKNDEHKTETTLDELTIAINPTAHNFGNWKKNEGADTHTRVCSFNNEHTETENCHGGTATCTEQAVCERCNAKYGELAKHDYKDGVCIVCGIRRPSEGLGYSLNSDGTGYTVTGIGTCTDKELIIPSEYNAKPVTSIGYEAFRGCTGVTSITIPDSVTSIGDYTFYGCSSLTSITIPNSVTSIGEGAFLFCTSLTSVTIPDSVTSMGVGAFNGCSGLTSIIVVEGNSKYHSAGNCIIETATNTLILGCKTSVIPTDGSVTSIGEYAFALYTGLTSITIPDSVTSIDVAAFAYCTGLSSITIPDSVTSIGESAFSGCSELTSIIVVEGNSKYHSAGNCIIETETKTLILGCKTSDIPTDGSVTSIGDWAFAYCTGFSSITIPDSVTSISAYAFYECTGLTSITIPNSVTSIGDWAFAYCRSLTSITIPNSVTSIGAGSFESCTGLMTVNWNATATSAGSYDYPIFKDCSNLATVNIGYNVKIIPSYAFYNCTGLTSVTIGSGVTSIGYQAFYNCKGLTSITIPDSVTSIGTSTFYGCNGLTSVTIGNSVTSIATYAFFGCYRLIEVYNKSALSITAGSSSNGYVASYAKNVYTNEGGSKLATDENGYVIYTDGDEKILVAYLGTETELALPSYITKINQYAFYNCTGLTSVTIGNSVTSIGNEAFSGCTGLTSITFNGTIKQWNAVSKGYYWKTGVPSTCKVVCTDGTVSI